MKYPHGPKALRDEAVRLREAATPQQELVSACIEWVAMLAWLPLLVAVAAAACDYTLPDGTCCSATNSEGPQTLLKAPATLLAANGLTADLRLDLQFRPHPNEAWQPLDQAALVATHGRDDHVFVVRDDFGSVAHVHGAWEDSEFILRNVPFTGAGVHRVLASFAVDASVLNICVSKSSVHAHPTDSDTWVHAATESEVALPGLETMTSSPWDVSRIQNATPSVLVDGELTTAFATPRARLPSCPTGSEAIRLDLDASSTLELTQPRCTKLTWQVTAPLTPYLGAAAHVLIAKLNGALTHTHATLPERVTGDPCAAVFVGHFDDLDALPADLGHTVVGAAEFTEAGVYLVAAFFATGDDAVAAFHTVLVGDACVAAPEAAAQCATDLYENLEIDRWRVALAACEAGFLREPTAQPTVQPTLAPTVPAPIACSPCGPNERTGNTHFKQVFGTIVFSVPLGLLLCYYLRRRILKMRRVSNVATTATPVDAVEMMSAQETSLA